MNTIPNLDLLTEKELMDFWSKYHQASRKDAAELIGDKRPGYTNLAATLANYACNKATAISCRLRGDIDAAFIYEHAADICYNQLPSDLKW